jgi:hypothetical protein
VVRKMYMSLDLTLVWLSFENYLQLCQLYICTVPTVGFEQPIREVTKGIPSRECKLVIIYYTCEWENTCRFYLRPELRLMLSESSRMTLYPKELQAEQWSLLVITSNDKSIGTRAHEWTAVEISSSNVCTEHKCSEQKKPASIVKSLFKCLTWNGAEKKLLQSAPQEGNEVARQIWWKPT